jgi:hypothetical protein
MFPVHPGKGAYKTNEDLLAERKFEMKKFGDGCHRRFDRGRLRARQGLRAEEFDPDHDFFVAGDPNLDGFGLELRRAWGLQLSHR